MRSMLIQTTSSLLLHVNYLDEDRPKSIAETIKKKSSQLPLDGVTNSSRNWIELRQSQRIISTLAELTIWTLNSSACLFVQIHQGITLLYSCGKVKESKMLRLRRQQPSKNREREKKGYNTNWADKIDEVTLECLIFREDQSGKLLAIGDCSMARWIEAD